MGHCTGGQDGQERAWKLGYVQAIRDMSGPFTLARAGILCEDPELAATEACRDPGWVSKMAEERAEAERNGRTPLRPLRRGTVYVFVNEAATKIKVGFTSRDVAVRMRQVEQSSGERLSVLHEMPGRTMATERMLHEFLADDKLDGEWFTPGPRVRQWFAAEGVEL